MRDTSVIEIDLAALDGNLRRLKRLVGPDCTLCPILKADAYGLGAVPIARRMQRHGCPMVAVYNPAEAEALLEAGIEMCMLVLRPVRGLDEVMPVMEALRAGRVHLTLHDAAQLEALRDVARRAGGPVHVHLDLDTGMSRGGCDLDEASALIETLADDAAWRLVGLSTHFACADADDALTDAQLRRFDGFLAAHARHLDDSCMLHVANSFATLRHARYHRRMVRIGLAWTGHGPEWMRGGRTLAAETGLRPILRWMSRVIQVRRIEPGTTVGYGASWTATRPSTIALVPVGYADGYPMPLATSDVRAGPVCIGLLDRHDESRAVGWAPVVGRVNMDQITVDVTDVVEAHGATAVEVGTPVELIGRSPAEGTVMPPNHLSALARAAGTIPYELLCRLNPRIPRVYHEAGLSVQTVEAKPAPAVRTPSAPPVSTAR